MFGIGSGELVLLGLVVLILFGPDKLPEIGRTIGRVMREFNRTKDIMESQIRAEMLSTESREAEEARRLETEASKQRAAARADDDEGADGQEGAEDESKPPSADAGDDTNLEEDEEG